MLICAPSSANDTRTGFFVEGLPYQAFLGLVNFLCKSIDDFRVVARVLDELA